MDDGLLALEERHGLWDVEADGLRLWPLVRVFLLNALLNKRLSYASLHKEGHKVYLLPHKWPRYARTLPFLLARKHHDYSALFWIPNLHRYPAQAGFSFDRRYAEFYAQIERPLIFEAWPTSAAMQPDQHYEQFIFSQDSLWLWAMGQTKIRRLPAAAIRQIDEFADFLATVYEFPALRARLAQLMQRFTQEHRIVRGLIARCIASRLKNAFAIVEDASYVGQNAIVTKTLHDMSFTVAEPQHGVIHPLHYAYQLPPSCLDAAHPCRVYLPDNLLTYGQYWSDIVNIPGGKTVIGLPYLSKIAQNVAPKQEAHSGQILILSSSVVVQPTVTLAQQLAKAFPERTILFKLHPLDSYTAEDYHALRTLPNIKVVTRADVYQLIAESEVVLSYYSTTVLVEAVVFPGKRVFFHEVGLLPPDIGEHFDAADDLIALIRDPTRGFPRCQPDQFWASNWQERLSKFLKEHLTSQ
jgi:hypothetical protein